MRLNLLFLLVKIRLAKIINFPVASHGVF
ncbi:MAG: hypothetical protein ACD_21C00255G0001, partial [uncultured bacterium]